jgi:4a-hydroxytetrahydrobiopterin dehydratase
VRLSEAEIQERLASLDGWRRDDEKWISRKYRFPSFVDAVLFVNGVAATAERRNHHPMIAVDYRVVTLKLTTWKAGGLTAEDFASAYEYERIYRALVGTAARSAED